jgi:hypothetical protein
METPESSETPELIEIRSGFAKAMAGKKASAMNFILSSVMKIDGRTREK